MIDDKGLLIDLLNRGDRPLFLRVVKLGSFEFRLKVVGLVVIHLFGWVLDVHKVILVKVFFCKTDCVV